MFQIYNLILIIAAITVSPLLIIKILGNKNLKIGFRDRILLYSKDFTQKIRETSNLIWIHASSVGEVNIAGIVAKNLKGKILITTMTYSGYENAVNSKNFDFVTFIPFDISFIIKRFYKIVKPTIILIAETEFWPNVFYYAKKMNIPLIVFNCRVSDNSFKSYSKYKFFFKNVLNSATYFLCQNQITQQRLLDLNVDKKRLILTKNIKFDLNFNIDPYSVLEEFDLLQIKDHTILTAGSTHEGEELIIIEVFKNLLKNYQNLILLLAPRHIDRVKDIEDLLHSHNFTYSLLSESNFKRDSKILILDKIGYLVKAYSISDICFVGGSLILRGGHNPLEAVYFKKPVISGKNIFNFREIYSILESNGGVIFVSSKEELESEIIKLIGNKEYSLTVAQKGFEVLENNKGALQMTLKYIEECLS